MELVLPMYNAHPYFSLKNLVKKVRLVHSRLQLRTYCPAYLKLTEDIYMSFQVGKIISLLLPSVTRKCYITYH